MCIWTHGNDPIPWRIYRSKGWELSKKSKRNAYTTCLMSYSNTPSLRSLPSLRLLMMPGSGVHLMPHPAHDQLCNCAVTILGQLRTISLLVHPHQTFCHLGNCEAVSISVFKGQGWEGTEPSNRSSKRVAQPTADTTLPSHFAPFFRTHGPTLVM